MVAEQNVPVTSPALAQLRWEFVTLLGKIENTETLRRMLKLCLIALQEEDTEEISPELLAALERAIEESYDETDLIPNEEITQRAYQRLILDSRISPEKNPYR